MKESLIGVIADTHGLLRAAALDALRGCKLILHAGDIGGSDVLDGLRRLAPVVAVRGNIDCEGWCERLPETEAIECAGRQLYMLHKLELLDLNPAAAGFAAVIYGHSHKPAMHIKRDVLYFNPGSAGPRRFRLPVSVGRLRLTAGNISGELITLG